jgi:hypothetical protein
VELPLDLIVVDFLYTYTETYISLPKLESTSCLAVPSVVLIYILVTIEGCVSDNCGCSCGCYVFIYAYGVC